MALANATMNGCCWPAPAPCARISTPFECRSGAAGAAGYTSAVVLPRTGPPSTSTESSLGMLKRLPYFRVRLETARDRESAELTRERSGQHLVDLGVDDARQRHAPVLDDDVDGR